MSDPYGIKLFETIVNHLWDNHKVALKKEHLDMEFPDYLGLPRIIANKLSTDTVQQIQWGLGFGPFENKKHFKETLKHQLFLMSDQR